MPKYRIILNQERMFVAEEYHGYDEHQYWSEVRGVESSDNLQEVQKGLLDHIRNNYYNPEIKEIVNEIEV